jgi:hypothetical protein
MKYLLYFSLLTFIAISSCKKDAAPDIIYQNTLVTADQAWTVDSNSLDVRKFYQGHYSIRVDSTEIISYTLAPYSTINFPYTVQVDGTAILDDPGMLGGMAIVFNYVDHGDYDVAEIWTDGTYRIWIRTNGNISTFVNFTSSSAINAGSGSKNTIKVIQNQSDMQLVINGTSMGTFTLGLPSSLVQTGPATFTASPPYYTPVTTLFNNFSIVKN